MLEIRRSIRRSFMSGLVLSTGSRTEHLMRASRGALHAFLTKGEDSKESSVTRVKAVGEDILWLMNKYRGERRVTRNILRTLSALLSEEIFAPLLADEDDVKLYGYAVRFGCNICKAVGKELGDTEDVAFLISGARVYLGVLGFPGMAREQAAKKCLDMLEHSFPKVRRCIAEEMYSQLLLLDEEFSSLGEDAYDEILESLSETSWDSDLQDLYPTIDTLHTHFGFPKPSRKIIEKKQTSDKSGTGGAKAKPSYLDLVKEMGF
eukprot:CAMPEP_0197541406 /NCGR_PEP_ID=MMETSP1318-20131121/67140_1 /TAXON_ID=552666 /ORGANISM="Partenskyella glossopodia, Strain RCC365" /LENGTH=262 /DNA_ID=CAMNT_0043100573 /DNA_START=1020 /DNA_END=1808 /DNA_ORIENTATION=+